MKSVRGRVHCPAIYSDRHVDHLDLAIEDRTMQRSIQAKECLPVYRSGNSRGLADQDTRVYRSERLESDLWS
jgi:hypothetical protein